MKRSEINRYILETGDFFTRHGFYLPVWAQWSPQEWETKAVRTYEQRTTIRYQVSEISAFYPDCW